MPGASRDTRGSRDRASEQGPFGGIRGIRTLAVGADRSAFGHRGIPACRCGRDLRGRKDTPGHARGQTRDMTTRRLLGVLLVVMTVTVAVARTRQAAPGAAGRAFPVTGVVTAAPADGRVMVAHEAIAGYMPAMTMPFALAPGEPVPALTPGDRVRFTLRVDDGAARATAFEVVGRDESVAAALRGAPRRRVVAAAPGRRAADVSLRDRRPAARSRTSDLRATSPR